MSDGSGQQAARDGREGWLAALAVYLDRRVIAILFLGFSSGLPLLLTLSTLSIWLKEAGVDKTTIGLFALVTLPYSTKFLWSPLVDRLYLPFLTPVLGRRRGWAILTQLALMAGIIGLGQTDPAADPWATAIWAFFVAFASASQDIVIDAYRIEILEERQFGAGAANYVTGYRIALLVAGAGALFLAEAIPWNLVYGIMALLIVVGIATVLLNPEPQKTDDLTDFETTLDDWIDSQGRALDVAAGFLKFLVVWIYKAAILPFIDYMSRPYWLVILVFIVFYKFGDSLAGVMAGPFYIEIGFSKAEIASVSKIFGMLATLGGAVLGGLMVARLGIMQSLLWAGFLQMLSNLMFAFQAMVGHDLAFLTLTIGIENASGGMGTAAFVAYLSALCNLSYTATQYALLTSFMSFSRTTLSSSGGYIADQFDWVTFFVITTVAAVPGLLLLWWLRRRGHDPKAEAQAAVAQPAEA